MQPWNTRNVVAAVHFYATAKDQGQLLDYLGEPDEVTLCPWPVLASPPSILSREGALLRSHVMVVGRVLGPPVAIRAGDAAMAGGSKGALFNRLNWERTKPKSNEGLVDSNTSPVLLWTPATQCPDRLRSGTIGSQADSMAAVSRDYARWVNRTTSWVRRKGTRVWGLDAQDQRTDLNVRRPDFTTVYALPDAFAALQAGAAGR